MEKTQDTHEERGRRRDETLSGIEESLHILDKHRLEIKQWLTSTGRQSRLNYEVETWFFLPTSLQINRWNYDPQSCRQRLKNYIRENAPLVALTDLDKDHPLLAESASLLEQLAKMNAPALTTRLEEILRLYALLYQRALSHNRRDIEASFERGEVDAASKAALDLCGQAAGALSAYRSLRKILPGEAPETKADIGQDATDEGADSEAKSPGSSPTAAFGYCDEFLSIITTHHISTLLGQIPPSQAAARHRLKIALKDQMRYRLAFYPESVPDEEGDNEIPVYRWGVLKKYVAAPLFLEARPRSGTHPLVHTVYILSAVFAMIFATAMTLFVRNSNDAISPALFAIIVVGYIFRDRFKEFFRSRMFKLTQRWVPDRRQEISADRNTSVGRCDESFRFVNSERQLPKEVRLMRDRKHIVEVDNSFRSEDILYYSKTVNITRMPNPFAVGTPQVMDIWRFDISDFLLHTTEAPEELPVMDDERIPLGTKVYHVNMIRRITENGCEAWERYRLILTSEGIKRVDEVFALCATPPAG